MNGNQQLVIVQPKVTVVMLLNHLYLVRRYELPINHIVQWGLYCMVPTLLNGYLINENEAPSKTKRSNTFWKKRQRRLQDSMRRMRQGVHRRNRKTREWETERTPMRREVSSYRHLSCSRTCPQDRTQPQLGRRQVHRPRRALAHTKDQGSHPDQTTP